MYFPFWNILGPQRKKDLNELSNMSVELFLAYLQRAERFFAIFRNYDTVLGDSTGGGGIEIDPNKTSNACFKVFAETAHILTILQRNR